MGVGKCDVLHFREVDFIEALDDEDQVNLSLINDHMLVEMFVCLYV